jgi:hypothetical protein
VLQQAIAVARARFAQAGAASLGVPDNILNEEIERDGPTREG